MSTLKEIRELNDENIQHKNVIENIEKLSKRYAGESDMSKSLLFISKLFLEARLMKTDNMLYDFMLKRPFPLAEIPQKMFNRVKETVEMNIELKGESIKLYREFLVKTKNSLQEWQGIEEKEEDKEIKVSLSKMIEAVSDLIKGDDGIRVYRIMYELAETNEEIEARFQEMYGEK